MARAGTRVLIFNQQGHREAVELLEGLFKAIKTQESLDFDHVIFCPTVPVDKLGNRGISALVVMWTSYPD
jgi:folylpolyglutamate synthase